MIDQGEQASAQPWPQLRRSSTKVQLWESALPRERGKQLDPAQHSDHIQSSYFLIRISIPRL